MRVVLDTNVIVSGLLLDGSVPAQVSDRIVGGACDWLVDARIVAEYRRVFERPFLHFRNAAAQRILDVAEQDAIWIDADPLPITLPDETDRPFLEVAVSGGADALVTGNIKDFHLKEGRIAISIVTPRQFLDLLAGR